MKEPAADRSARSISTNPPLDAQTKPIRKHNSLHRQPHTQPDKQNRDHLQKPLFRNSLQQ